LLVALKTKTIELEKAKSRHDRLRVEQEKVVAMEGEKENYATAYETLASTVTDLNFKVSVLERCIKLKRLLVQERVSECSALIQEVNSVREKYAKLLALTYELNQCQAELHEHGKSLIEKRDKYSEVCKEYNNAASSLQRDLIFKEKQKLF